MPKKISLYLWFHHDLVLTSNFLSSKAKPMLAIICELCKILKFDLMKIKKSLIYKAVQKVADFSLQKMDI